MRVLAAGLAGCDLILKPVDESTLRRDTSTAETLRLLGGGDAYNVAVNLASLGVPVSLRARVGADAMGDQLRAFISQAEVDTSALLTDDAPTMATAVMISSAGERRFLSQKGAGHRLCLADFPVSLLTEYDLLTVNSAFDLPGLDGPNLEALLRRAQALKLVTVLDTTGEPPAGEMRWFADVLPYVDHFLPSLREALSLTGTASPEEAADAFLRYGAGSVAIKLGEAGCLLARAGEFIRIPAYPAEAVDTTGAGDAFVAGYIAGLYLGRSAPECARLGNASGAATVEAVGASGHLQSMEALTARAGLTKV